VKILLVTSDFPYRDIRHGGGQLTAQWIEHLGRRHDLSLLSFIRGEEIPFLEETSRRFRETRTVPARRGWSSRLRRLPMLLRHPYPVVATHSRRMAQAVREMTAGNRFDLVQFEYFHMGQYLPFVPRGTARVLVYHDVVTPVLRQRIRRARGLHKFLLYREWELSRYWEKWFAIWAGNAFALSPKDRRVIDSWDVGVRSFVLPPLLPPSFFRLKRRARRDGEIVFIGAMHRPVNQDAARFLHRLVLPLLRERHPGARIRIVGENPPSWLRRLQSDSFIVTGGVESIEPFLAEADALAVPLRTAGGIIVKILQGMAAAVPVVATRAANAGIGGRDGRHLLLADRPEEFAAALGSLLDDPARADGLGAGGAEFIRRHFAPEDVQSAIDRLYEGLTE